MTKKEWIKPDLIRLLDDQVKTGGQCFNAPEGNLFFWAIASTICIGGNTENGGITYNWGAYTPGGATNTTKYWAADDCPFTGNFVASPSACVS